MNGAMLADQFTDQMRNRFFIANVASRPIRLATVFDDFRCDTFELVGLASDQQNMGAEGGQFVGGATTDATAATGDNDVLASKQVGFENRIVGHGGSPLVDLVGDALRHRNLDFQ
ncbi:hypothetical protein D3C85_1374040 [compost metagenome]